MCFLLFKMHGDINIIKMTLISIVNYVNSWKLNNLKIIAWYDLGHIQKIAQATRKQQ